MFRIMFNVSMDLGDMSHIEHIGLVDSGKIYWVYDYGLAIFFGGPEIEAQLVWKDKVSRRSQTVYVELTVTLACHLICAKGVECRLADVPSYHDGHI